MEIISLLMGLGIILVVFLILRNIMLWYWKVPDIVKNQQEQIRLLKKVVDEKNLTKSFKCGSCGFDVINLDPVCSNCNKVMNYPPEAYNNTQYTCSNAECKKKFYGRKPKCPHCAVANNW